MTEQNVQVKSWEEISKMLSKESHKIEFVSALNEIAKRLKKTKTDYVYYAEFEFGTKLIDKGKINLNQFVINENTYSLNKTNFKHDLNYSNDPLGFVVEGYLEIVTNNLSEFNNKKKNYFTLLNRINRNELFGVFGTLDKLYDTVQNDIEEKWDAYAGDVTYEISFPWENTSDTLFNFNSDLKKLFDINENVCSSEQKINFYKELFSNENELPKVKVVYFPKHFVEDIKGSDFHNELLKIGWKQSTFLRNLQLEFKTIMDTVSGLSVRESLTHSLDFLAFFVQHIIYTHKGSGYALTPAVNDVFLKALLSKIKAKNLLYFKNKTHFIPLFFKYEKLKTNQTGLISVISIPILLNYKIKDFKVLCTELKKILSKIDDKYGIVGYANTKSENLSILCFDKLKDDYLTQAFTIQEKDNINVSCNEFSNIILLKRQ